MKKAKGISCMKSKINVGDHTQQYDISERLSFNLVKTFHIKEILMVFKVHITITEIKLMFSITSTIESMFSEYCASLHSKLGKNNINE